jgi:outer membrane receptor for ferrienterochelin and colicins
MKLASTLLVFLFLMNGSMSVSGQSFEIRGQVFGENSALTGAHITWNQSVDVSNSNGHFSIKTNDSKGILRISFLGYEAYSIQLELKEQLTDLKLIELRSDRIWSNSDVVITATRTLRDVESVAQPVSVVSNKEIKQAGSLRLNDILLEQVGMTLTSDHGTGIQLQGMDADYALILVDGQPLVGRTSGTLDLTRIAVGNIKQIEIVKGPSSALWGSEALGGVINIITEKPGIGSKTSVSSRIGSFLTNDIGVESSLSLGNYSQSVFLNRNASNGYKLNPNSVSNTVPEFQNYTLSYRGTTKMSEKVEFELRSRTFYESQVNQGSVTENEQQRLLKNAAFQYDVSVIPVIRYQLNGSNRLEFIHNSTWFGANSENRYQDNGALFSDEPFNQRMHRTEFQWDANWKANHRTTTGAGYTYETLQADRYVANPVFNSTFGFVQHDWDITQRLNVTAGLRADYHSEYSGEISPKLAIRYELFDYLHLKASAGNGFRAPEFRQLFLNFTNATAGYSVFGSSTIKESLAELQSQGEISRLIVDPSTLSAIQAERSFAVNVGFDFIPVESFRTKLNVFRNRVNNLIDSQPIAVKNNGQSVFTYFNLNEIYTQGVEVELHWDILPGLSIMTGYAYLEAIDEQIVEQVENGLMFRRNPQTNLDERVALADYGGLFNRSRHSGSARLFYTSSNKKWEGSVRVILRGRYGFIDRNNNQILDQANEYERGYSLTNISLAHYLWNSLCVQLGSDNVFNFTRPNQLGFLPGRIFYLQLNYNLN